MRWVFDYPMFVSNNSFCYYEAMPLLQSTQVGSEVAQLALQRIHMIQINGANTNKLFGALFVDGT